MLYNVCLPSFWLPNFTLTTVEERQWVASVQSQQCFRWACFRTATMFSCGNDVFLRWIAGLLSSLPSCWRPSRDVAVTATSPSGKMVNCYELELAIACHLIFFSHALGRAFLVWDRIIINASHPFKLVNFKQKCWHMRRQCVPGSFFRPHTN